MAHTIKICLDYDLYPKCQGCPHLRTDPDRNGEKSCFLDEDLQGKERLDYLLRLKKYFNIKEE